MAIEPSPLWDEELFNSIELAGVKSPGTVKLSGHDRKINWDVKAGKGQSGASTTLKDIPLIEFTAAFYLADEEDFQDWTAFRELINSTVSGATPKALDIYHPSLAANKIKSVVLASMGGDVFDGKGGKTVTVKFQEYAPPKKKGGAPRGGSSKPSAVVDPNAAANAELARLTEQYKNTPWGG